MKKRSRSTRSSRDGFESQEDQSSEASVAAAEHKTAAARMIVRSPVSESQESTAKLVLDIAVAVEHNASMNSVMGPVLAVASAQQVSVSKEQTELTKVALDVAIVVMKTAIREAASNQQDKDALLKALVAMQSVIDNVDRNYLIERAAVARESQPATHLVPQSIARSHALFSEDAKRVACIRLKWFSSVVSTDELVNVYQRYGDVLSVLNLSKSPNPCAFVQFKTREQAMRAIRETNGVNILGFIASVTMSRYNMPAYHSAREPMRSMPPLQQDAAKSQRRANK